nr:hypothetical protein [uncultured Rhodopila sp.]
MQRHSDCVIAVMAKAPPEIGGWLRSACHCWRWRHWRCTCRAAILTRTRESGSRCTG